MNLRQIEEQLLTVIEQCKALGVPASELDDMSALNRAGEPGVALENLCTQLLEHRAAVPAEILQSLQRLGLAMGINEKYWKRLE